MRKLPIVTDPVTEQSPSSSAVITLIQQLQQRDRCTGCGHRISGFASHSPLTMRLRQATCLGLLVCKMGTIIMSTC